jgi:hypothetical protein
MMPGKILKRRRKRGQSEPPILNRLEMAANLIQDIKNRESEVTKNAAVFTFLFRQVIGRWSHFLCLIEFFPDLTNFFKFHSQHQS